MIPSHPTRFTRRPDRPDRQQKSRRTSRRPFCWLGPLTAYFFFFAAFFLVAFFAVFFFAAMRVSPGLWFVPVQSPDGVVGPNRIIAYPVVRSRQTTALFCELPCPTCCLAPSREPPTLDLSA